MSSVCQTHKTIHFLTLSQCVLLFIKLSSQQSVGCFFFRFLSNSKIIQKEFIMLLWVKVTQNLILQTPRIPVYLFRLQQPTNITLCYCWHQCIEGGVLIGDQCKIRSRAFIWSPFDLIERIKIKILCLFQKQIFFCPKKL